MLNIRQIEALRHALSHLYETLKRLAGGSFGANRGWRIRERRGMSYFGVAGRASGTSSLITNMDVVVFCPLAWR
jgi:hypothetical protein